MHPKLIQFHRSHRRKVAPHNGSKGGFRLTQLATKIHPSHIGIGQTTHLHTCTRMHVSTAQCAYIHTYIHTYVHTHAHAHADTHTYVHMYMYTYIYTVTLVSVAQTYQLRKDAIETQTGGV